MSFLVSNSKERAIGASVLHAPVRVWWSSALLAFATHAVAAEGDSDSLQEVVVTATRQAEPLSKVPISISAYSREQMDEQSVRGIQDVAALTPGLTVGGNVYAAVATADISIRGIDSSTGASTTGIYVDDTPIQATQLGYNFVGTVYPKIFDLDRVEVLRGPQGTLFGSGAEGGAVRFITPQPSLTHYSGYSRLEMSETEHGDLSYEAGAAVGGPIVQDVLGFRVSAWYANEGGFVDRQSWETGSLNRNANWDDSKVVRAALTLAPAPGITITPSVFYQQLFYADTFNYWTSLSTPSSGRFVNGNALPQPTGDKFYLPALRFEAAFDGMTLTSVSSYFDRIAPHSQDYTTVYFGLFGGSFFPTLPGQFVSFRDDSTTTQHNFSQEIRLQSSRPEAQLRWLVGMFYQKTSQIAREFGISPLFPEVLGLDPGILIDNQYTLTLFDQVKTDQFALFANTDYQITPRLKLTTGVRAERSRVDLVSAGDGYVNGGPSSSRGQQSARPVTPKIALSFQADPNNLYYTGIAKGYRSGGPNAPVPPSLCSTVVPSTFGPDTTWSYELGAKNRLLDGHLQLDSSVFHIKWDKIQQQVLLPCQYVYTSNLGEATSDGFDVAARVLLAAHLKIDASVGYTRAKYVNDVLANGLVLAQKGASIGDPINGSETSPWSLSLSTRYDFRLNSRLIGYLQAQDQYHSRNPGPFTSHNPDAVNYDPTLTANPATNLASARLGTVANGLDVSLFVDNLFDAHPALGYLREINTDPIYRATTFRPRTVGLTATYAF